MAFQLNAFQNNAFQIIKIAKRIGKAFKRYWHPPEKVEPPKSIEAVMFVKAVEGSIKETGVVDNKHVPYNPKTNPRKEVSKEEAARIAHNIAKREGYRVGEYKKS